MCVELLDPDGFFVAFEVTIAVVAEMGLVIEIGKATTIDMLFTTLFMNNSLFIQRTISDLVFCFVFHSARGGTRTHMGLLPHHFK